MKTKTSVLELQRTKVPYKVRIWEVKLIGIGCLNRYCYEICTLLPKMADPELNFSDRINGIEIIH